MPLKPIICIDFDGVLNNYNGYDGDNLGTPRPGAKEFLEKLSKMIAKRKQLVMIN